MAYFECDHGTKYYPFGVGGREATLTALNIQKHVQNGTSNDKLISHVDSNSTSSSSANRLSQCPFHAIPLAAHVSETNSDMADDGRMNYGSVMSTPVVLRSPLSTTANIFSNLADDTLAEIFKVILGAHMVSFYFSIIIYL